MMEKLALRRLFVTSLLILLLFNFLVTSSASAAITNTRPVKVSPGQIPGGVYDNLPAHNDYLNTSEAQVKLEYPEGMVLQQTIGDLLFNVTLSSAIFRTIDLYIPPEFVLGPNSSYIWSSITNNYRYISLRTLSNRDPIAPLWYRIEIRNGTGSINASIPQFVRLFNVTAPSIVGLYFFKAFIDGKSIGWQNFPILVVSADPNPAYISGTVVDCSSNLFRYNYGYGYGYYGGPLRLGCLDGGKVIAEGVTPDGRKVVGQAFFNSSALGHYTVYGLAAGTYNLTAYASGYWPTIMNNLVTVRPGQSADGIDLCITSCPTLEGIVRSKCENMPVPWGFIANHSAPGFGAAFAYVGSTSVVGGGGCAQGDFIYAFRGNGTSDFLKYNTVSNKWTFVSPAPGQVGGGGSLAYDGSEYIYALQGGGSSALWAYDVTIDQWQTEQSLTGTNGRQIPEQNGSSIAYDSDTGILYALIGNTTDLYSYSPTLNQWPSVATTPNLVGAGGSLVFDSNNGNLYALRGGGTSDFWSYNPTTNSWNTPLTPPTTPVVISAGGSLSFDSSNDLIYALEGGGTNTFLSYNPSAPPATAWSTLPITPINIGPGGSLTFDTSNDLTYALIGGNSYSPSAYNFSDYNSVSSLWNKSLARVPALYPRPVTIEILDSLDNSWRLLQNVTDPNSLSYNFTYDGSTELDGHIPQDFSGYVAGILPEPYKVRVWINQYLQPNDTIVDFSSYLNPAVVQVDFDVFRSGSADIRIDFKDFPQGTPLVNGVPRSETVTVELYDKSAILRGENYTTVAKGAKSADVIVTGFLGTLRDYGLPDETYNVTVTTPDFFQYYYFSVTTASCSMIEASLDVVQFGSLQLSVRSVNSQSPRQPQIWKYPGANIRVDLVDQYNGLVYGTFFTRQNPFSSSASVTIPGLRGGKYLIHVYTIGYYQENMYNSSINIVDGLASDFGVNVVVGSTIDLSVILEKEGLPASIDTYPFSRVPFRAELYDSLGNFVAANITYVPASSKIITLELAGFSSYAGDPALRWVNYYDATDGRIQTDYGLPPGSYRVLAYLPGYSQGYFVSMVTVSPGGQATIEMDLNRLAHLTGNVTSLNMFGVLVPINWATIDAVGSKTRDYTYTLNGYYSMWLQEDKYLVFPSLPYYNPTSTAISLSNGSDAQINFRLQSFMFSVPEFNSNLGYLSALVVGVIAANLLLRRPRSKFKRQSSLT